MRVIAGAYKGRKLHAVPGEQTRPTSDKVKESVFNMIGPYFDGGRCLDLYAGSGALSIEAVSRGMDKAVLIETHHPAIKTIQANLALTKEENKFDVRKSTASHALAKIASESALYALVFLDPPYLHAEAYILENLADLAASGALDQEALVVCETDKKTDLPEKVADLSLWKKNKYGSTKVWIYRKENGGR